MTEQEKIECKAVEFFNNWKKEHSEDEMRRIDTLDGTAIEGIKKYYALSSGYVISCVGKNAKVLALNPIGDERDGYRSVTIDKPRYIHRIILETFKDKIDFYPPNLNIIDYEAHHIDKTKDSDGFIADNSVENLMGLTKKIHNDLFNKKVIENLLTDEKKSNKYVSKIAKHFSNCNETYILFTGETKSIVTGEYSTDGIQAISKCPPGLLIKFSFKYDMDKFFVLSDDMLSEEYLKDVKEYIENIEKVMEIKEPGFDIAIQGKEIRILYKNNLLARED